MKITSAGDKELWVVKGKTRTEETKNLHWWIPVIAQPGRSSGDKVYVVQAGVALNSDQYLLLATALGSIAIKKSDTRWVIDYYTFQDRFDKAPGITPSAYVRWKMRPAKDEGQDQEEADEKPSEIIDDHFLSWLKKRSSFDPGDLTLAWRLVTRNIPVYLMEVNRPIDLSFAKIGALPYRVNWKNIVVGRNPELARIFKLCKRDQSDLVRYSDAIRHLRTSDLIELRQSTDAKLKSFTWNLELIPSAAWDHYVNMIERERYTTMTNHYPSHWANCVTKNESFITEALAVFTRKITRACARVHQCPKTGFFSLVQKYFVEPLRRNRLWTFTDTTVCLPDPESFVDAPEEEIDVVEPDEGMSQVPIIFTPDENLRDRRGDDE